MRPRVRVEVDQDSTAVALVGGKIVTESAGITIRMEFDWDSAQDALVEWDRAAYETRSQIEKLIPAGSAERKRAQDLR
jgi:hypothetical protein